ncbi:MAG: hypothetical protein MUF84_01220 [Anaerolineae bacterium]|jgi:ERCC4-type nuclease|nr:hypothetical protein [Anaerolineae bacterium]
MTGEVTRLRIWATKPASPVSVRLWELGLDVVPIEEDEGDVDRYVLGPQLAVERRTARTFLLGIQDKTLFTSAIYLREHFEIPVVVVEGAINYAASGFHPQAIRGALSSMMLEYGLSVVSTPDAEETASLLAMMARHAQVGIPEISLVPKRKAVNLPDLERRVVEMLPSCGRVAARDLLQHFGSVECIVRATVHELQQVRGIGAARAAEIHRVLHADYDAVDTEQNLEDAIQVAPSLLFDHPVDLLARQHLFITAAVERNIVDLAYWDPQNAALVLVELKRGGLTSEHETQLRRYLATAQESPLFSNYLQAGARLRGILATVSRCTYTPESTDIQAVIVDEAAVIAVLKELRNQRQPHVGGL